MASPGASTTLRASPVVNRKPNPVNAGTVRAATTVDDLNAATAGAEVGNGTPRGPLDTGRFSARSVVAVVGFLVLLAVGAATFTVSGLGDRFLKPEAGSQRQRALAQLTCVSISGSVTDGWCSNNCNHIPAYCPPNMCSCSSGKTDGGDTDNGAGNGSGIGTDVAAALAALEARLEIVEGDLATAKADLVTTREDLQKAIGVLTSTHDSDVAGVISSLDGVLCDDGVFCNGGDSLLSGVCDQHSGDPCAGNAVNTLCNEAERKCEDPGPCPEDGWFCNGPGKTFNDGGCDDDGNPCGPVNSGQYCNEFARACEPVSTALASIPDGTTCEDGLFCNGQSTFVGGQCVESGNPCGAGETCNEARRRCDAPLPVIGSNEIPADGTACDDGDECTDNDVYTDQVCAGSASPLPPVADLGSTVVTREYYEPFVLFLTGSSARCGATIETYEIDIDYDASAGFSADISYTTQQLMDKYAGRGGQKVVTGTDIVQLPDGTFGIEETFEYQPPIMFWHDLHFTTFRSLVNGNMEGDRKVGPYPIRLRVTDSNGQTGEVSKHVLYPELRCDLSGSACPMPPLDQGDQGGCSGFLPCCNCVSE